MDEKALIRYLATGDYAPSAVPAEDMSLAEHDARWHPNGYKEGDKCLFRANLDKGDKSDADVANASPKEGGISGIFTGSAADYSKPSLLKVGTGEGTQVYGWGLYGSTERGVAEGYARQGRNLNVAAGDAEYELDGKSLDRKNDVIDSALTYLASERMNTQKAIEEVNRAIDGFKKQLEDTNERLEWDKNNFRLQMDAESLPRRISHLNEVKGFLERDGGKIRQILPSENIYEQTFFINRAPGDESHLLNWYEPMSDENIKRVMNQYAKENDGADLRADTPSGTITIEDFGDRKMFGNALKENEEAMKADGASLYRYVSGVLGSEQAASEFLARAGIDGIKYPVDSFGGKTIKDGNKAGWNYVSFSDDNIRVDRKWRDGEEVDDAARTKIERYLALDAAPMSLAAHDRLYHHGLFTGGRCLYRANQSADDPADALLVNANLPKPDSPRGGSAPTPQGKGLLADEIEAVKYLYTKTDGTHSKSWLHAPNGKPSNLTPDQWCLVRTPTFKKWFGDWEKQAEVASAIDYLRSTPPVAILRGDEFPPGGEKLTESVPAYWKKHNDGIAVSPDFGAVRLDREGVKSDLGHGISRLKSIAFAAVPEVIENGIAYNRAKNWKGREWDSAVIGAPIKIGTDDYYCEVVIQRRPNRQGFYLHDVELKAKSEAAFKTPTQGSAAPLSKLIVAKLLAEVNPATVSKIVDSNGEPRLMFHGTSSRFSKFDPKYIRSTNWGKGFYFTSSEEDARHYGSIVMPCFLKSDNPLDLTTSANDAEYNKWYGKKNSPYDGFYTDISGKLMCVVPKSSQIFVAPDSPKKSDGLDLREIADAVLAEDAANNSPDGQTAFDQSTPTTN